MLFDDYVMRQIQKIGELAAAITARSTGQDHVNVDGELAEAYRALVGMEREMVDRLGPESLARLLGEPRQITALALLMQADGDLCAAREQPDEARRRWERGLALLGEQDPELRRSLEARLAGV